MKEGLWNRFKDAVAHIMKDSISFSKEYDFGEGIDESCNFLELNKLRRTTFKIQFSVPLCYDLQSTVLFRWAINKVKKAIKEVREE